jgi:hypothetical protein
MRVIIQTVKTAAMPAVPRNSRGVKNAFCHLMIYPRLIAYLVTFTRPVRRIAVCIIYCLFNNAVSTAICVASNGRAIGKGRKWLTGIIFQHLTEGVGRLRNMYQMWLHRRPRIPLMWLAQVAYNKQ